MQMCKCEEVQKSRSAKVNKFKVEGLKFKVFWLRRFDSGVDC